MHITLISIFPEIFTSFLETSLIQKAQEKKLISFTCSNPRDFCPDKHKQIDDEIYGGGNGMLMKAEPVIQCVEYAIQGRGTRDEEQGMESKEDLLGRPKKDFHIIFLTPSKTIFTQKIAATYANTCQHLILVCGRYEGIDYRFQAYMQQTYPANFTCLSLGRFILLGGEVAAMTVVEAVVRLIPGVIKEEGSWQDESYNSAKGEINIEYPQYTRPEEVRGLRVPEVLLSGHHAKIQQRRDENQTFI